MRLNDSSLGVGSCAQSKITSGWQSAKTCKEVRGRHGWFPSIARTCRHSRRRGARLEAAQGRLRSQRGLRRRGRKEYRSVCTGQRKGTCSETMGVASKRHATDRLRQATSKGSPVRTARHCWLFTSQTRMVCTLFGGERKRIKALFSLQKDHPRARLEEQADLIVGSRDDAVAGQDAHLHGRRGSAR